MAFGNFTLEELESRFQLRVREVEGLFADVPEVPMSSLLAQELDEYVSLALAMNTEKARSELIIAPLLADFRRAMKRQIGLFSGIDFDVEPESGLNGVCDFLISRVPSQMFLRAPVVAVVEAHLPQCVAAMVAVRKFNEKVGQQCDPVFGVVTSGDNWKFVKMTFPNVDVGMDEYLIANPAKIIGILVHMMNQYPPQP